MFLLLLKPMKLDYSILRKEHPPSYFTSEVAVIHEVLSLFLGWKYTYSANPPRPSRYKRLLSILSPRVLV